MYCLMNKIKINWVNMIRKHLFKVGKKLEYRIPYVILLSQFIKYFEIDVEIEVVEEIKALNQITTTNLTKIGLKKMKNIKWICKADEDSVGDDEEEKEKSTDDDDEDDEDEDKNADQAEPEPETPAAPSQDSFSRLEQLMMTQFNQLENWNRSHHQYCETHFQFIETQVEDIHSKMGTLFFPPDA